MIISKKEEMQRRYPEGTKIELIFMDGEPQMYRGLQGTVEYIDDIGQIHMKWENGSSLALVQGVDRFRKAREGVTNN